MELVQNRSYEEVGRLASEAISLKVENEKLRKQLNETLHEMASIKCEADANKLLQESITKENEMFKSLQQKYKPLFDELLNFKEELFKIGNDCSIPTALILSNKNLNLELASQLEQVQNNESVSSFAILDDLPNGTHRIPNIIVENNHIISYDNISSSDNEEEENANISSNDNNNTNDMSQKRKISNVSQITKIFKPSFEFSNTSAETSKYDITQDLETYKDINDQTCYKCRVCKSIYKSRKWWENHYIKLHKSF